MFEQPGLHGHVVNEGPVETFEVGDYETLVFFLDFGVPARDGSVCNTKVCGGFTADNQRFFVDGEDGAF